MNFKSGYLVLKKVDAVAWQNYLGKLIDNWDTFIVKEQFSPDTYKL